MNKLAQAFKANPTAANAAKIIKHADKHPMTACVFSTEIEEAKAVIQAANTPEQQVLTA